MKNRNPILPLSRHKRSHKIIKKSLRPYPLGKRVFFAHLTHAPHPAGWKAHISTFQWLTELYNPIKRTAIITLWQTQHGFRALSRPQKKLWDFEVRWLSQNDKNSFSQLSPKLSTIDPMFINNTNINVPIPHLLSPKLRLYDIHSSS